MEHHALRKYRGPEIWARVRTAYLAGEPAPSVARRFDVGLGNLRKRASAEGWTRSFTARVQDLKRERSAVDPARQADPATARDGAGPEEAEEYPVTAREARDRAAQRAAWLIAEGRGAEAMTLIRAAEALTNLVGIPDLHIESPVQRFLRQRETTVAPAKAQTL